MNKIVVDALSIRHGGGLVLLVNLVECIARRDVQVVVLTNSKNEIGSKIISGKNVNFVVIDNSGSAFGAAIFRTFKIEKYLDSISDGNTTLVSFNSYVNSNYPQVTLHVNTIPFLPFNMRLKMVGFIRAIALNRNSIAALGNSILNIFESEYLRDLATAKYSKPVVNGVVRYFGTDMSRLNYRDLPAFHNRQNRIITITSGAPHKSNHETILAFEKLRLKQPALELLIVGNKANIIKQLKNIDSDLLEVEGIKYSGYVTREELAVLISSSKALVSMSSTESFYLVAIEAMFCGTPVIVKDIPAATELCDDSVVMVNSVDSVVDAYEELANNKKVWESHSLNGYNYSERFVANNCLGVIADDIIEARAM